MKTPMTKNQFNIKPTYARTSLAIMVVFALSGCGGGGSSSTLVKEDLTEHYTFIAAPYDAAAAGITITTDLNPAPYAPPPTSTLPIINDSDRTYDQQTAVNADAFWSEGYRGSGITIGIVDSGINPDHPDFFDDSELL